MANEPLQLNLGSLRSAMSLTLHTHHASRIWHGRAPTEGRPGIVGLNGFISVMNKMKRGAEQDDPYSDWWMLRIEDKLADTKASLQALREQVEQVLADIPPALSLGENLNVQPVKLPLFVNAQLGFAAVYLLADYDDLARKLILAHHTALIDRSTLERWLNDGAHALRSLFSLAQQYRYSGTTRDDFAAKNAMARTALEKFGELPQDVLEGTRRSRFAPPIARRGTRPEASGADVSESSLAFLRWRSRDRSSMGKALWESLLDRSTTPPSLIDDLYAMELQRIALNMQISLTHSTARLALECASRMAQAEATYLRRVQGHAASISTTSKESP